MIVLDTNVVSEGTRRHPNLAVKAWTDRQPARSLYLCTPVLAELRFGLELLAEGRRKTDLRAAIDRMEAVLFRDRILPFDIAAANEYARLAASRQMRGRRIDLMGGLVAAIARSQGASLATRNIADFGDLGVDLINPFEPLD
jgi:predicted nucleic acid-binding protein